MDKNSIFLPDVSALIVFICEFLDEKASFFDLKSVFLLFKVVY